MKTSIKKLAWYFLIFHAIVINMVIAVGIIFLQDVFSIYEFLLLWFFSCQLNSFGFYFFNKSYPHDKSISFSNEISFIDFVSFIKKMIYPFQVGNINGKPFFIFLVVGGYSVFSLFFLVSLLNIFFEVYPLTVEQNIFMYLYAIALYYVMIGFKKSLSTIS